jgi:hypothetical protein
LAVNFERWWALCVGLTVVLACARDLADLLLKIRSSSFLIMA